jgi:hypothetical protein
MNVGPFYKAYSKAKILSENIRVFNVASDILGLEDV